VASLLKEAMQLFEPETFLQRHAFVLTDDPQKFDFEDVFRLIAQTEWMQRVHRDTIRKSLEHTHVYALLAPGGSLAGCVSVLSDQVFNARLSNLVIVENHRGRGLGRWMMSTLLYSSRFKDVEAWQLIADDAQSLYRRFGFAVFEGDGEFMVLRRKSAGYD